MQGNARARGQGLCLPSAVSEQCHELKPRLDSDCNPKQDELSPFLAILKVNNVSHQTSLFIVFLGDTARKNCDLSVPRSRLES